MSGKRAAKPDESGHLAAAVLRGERISKKSNHGDTEDAEKRSGSLRLRLAMTCLESSLRGGDPGLPRTGSGAGDEAIQERILLRVLRASVVNNPSPMAAGAVFR